MKQLFNLLMTDETTVLEPTESMAIKKLTIFYQAIPQIQALAIYLRVKAGHLVAVSLGENLANEPLLEEETLMEVVLTDELTPIQWLSYLDQQAIKAKIKGYQANQQALILEPSQVATISEGLTEVLMVLKRLGYPLLEVKKAKPAKAVHRFTKAIAEIPFNVASFDSQATVYWQKRNEMLIKAGAVLKSEIPLNKNGSLGFSAKMGQQLRSEHQESIQDYRTTKDIILKSVNEVGLFLYFGGTNSWLELKDAEGKTIDEWTVVK